ncbi:MAG: maleylacetoacetate isomerase [Hyphomicrobiales bacterium]|nr:maleylacetoacetate isomerase [Hyphomicrobiales bacterium]
MKLYTYWRSTAAYRVRIALNLKGVLAEQVPVHLLRGGGDQHTPAYRALNPLRAVPCLVLDDGRTITQSLAIIEYLDELRPPPLLPADIARRAQVRAAAQLIACDIHPVNNLRVGAYLKDKFGRSQADVVSWMHHWMQMGLHAFQSLVSPHTPFCFGYEPGVADLCLTPQLYNARRWGLELSGLERLVEIDRLCMKRREFLDARPEAQMDRDD